MIHKTCQERHNEIAEVCLEEKDLWNGNLKF